MDRELFIIVTESLARQYRKDLSAGTAQNEDLWAVTLKMAVFIFGREVTLMIERWIFDSECGKYATADFPYRSVSELCRAAAGLFDEQIK